MKKYTRALQDLVRPHDLTVLSAAGAGAQVVDASGRIVAKLHLASDYNVRCAVLLLRRRGALTTTSKIEKKD